MSAHVSVEYLDDHISFRGYFGAVYGNNEYYAYCMPIMADSLEEFYSYVLERFPIDKLLRN